jgi:roadblock/LC7 domain-containing protein
METPHGQAARLSDLVAMEGVLLAFEFAPDGSLSDYRARTNLPREQAALAAQFSASITMMFNTLAGAFTALTSMKWTPQQAWAYAGGQYTVAIGGGYRGVFIETAKADFNSIFEKLAGSRW